MKKFLHEFTDYKNGFIKDNGWWEIVGDKLVNEAGGYHSYTPQPGDIIVEANNLSDLDWSFILKPNSKYGWLDLNGKFYGCAVQEHEDMAQKYFKTSERALEEAGYIKLFRSYPDGNVDWYSYKTHLTKKQEDFLLSRGFRIE